ncbi:SPW repeat protein [Pontibacter sp. BT310]|uniref:SPW repeat protein n=1 Tax=Pontibacter populi TaxID=890055 RepID=A0ABS6X6M8_9BACT|nr:MULTISPECIES: SPW repeat protein [Pontibacter]MBJ6116785.1 SPW repeat protein [Pontibacter sp. BT310]MBR0569207.1 SPW repeat protein [Microvirga sp. STS03]MBW3363638.1 SPW repeat protein [Pontibacter populi]
MWAQIINALLGIWLMASPAVFGFADDRTISNNAHIVGPVIASFGIIACWEATRVVRYYNLLPGAWLLLTPWVLGYDTTTAIVNDLVIGAAVIGLSLVKGKVSGTYGGGWSAIWKKDSLHATEARRQPRV